jgi:hypothetical protein
VKAFLFGATGMVGQGLLRECLLDPTVEHLLSIVRNSTGQQSAKLSELVHKDFFDFSLVASQLAGYDSCFHCSGPSSAGMTEEILYTVMNAFLPQLSRLLPQYVMTTEIFGRAMIPRRAERTPETYPRGPRHQSSRPCVVVARHRVSLSKGSLC